MNLNKNYYLLLGVINTSTSKEIKASYRNLSKKYHPDINKNIDIKYFNEIVEAYNILCSDKRSEYDIKSKFGNSYNEYYELLNVDIDIDYDKVVNSTKNFIKNEVLDIVVTVDDKFDGTVEYERWISCKKCEGSGKDISSKIIIKDNNGNILKTFEPEDGCDFCEGSGKDYKDNECSFCFGNGKIGLNTCLTCNGEQRILGKQKLKGIKIINDEVKIDAMGHSSKVDAGRSGYLLIKKQKSS